MNDPDSFLPKFRRSVRLPAFDYRRSGAYFVTICANDRKTIFVDEDMRLIVEEVWWEIPAHFPNVETDVFVVMPNHVHGILFITEEGDGASVVARHASPVGGERRGGVAAKSLGAIVGSFKSTVARRVNAVGGMPGAPVWQVNYYEHVIRSEEELDRIRQYIENNPARWSEDPENPENLQRGAKNV